MRIRTMALLGLFSAGVQAAPITHISADFNDGLLPPNLTTVFGSTDIVDGELRFNTGGTDSYEQLQLDIRAYERSGAGARAYHRRFRIDYDIRTENLANSGWSFSMFLDTPTVQVLGFNDCCSNAIAGYTPDATSPIGAIGTLTDGQSMSVSIDVDLDAGLWSIDIPGVGGGTGGFYTESGTIESMRLSLAPASGSITAPNSSISVYIDNLSVVSTVPLPGAVWLFGAGLAGLAGVASRRRPARGR